MANASDGSLPFAPVRSNQLFAAILVHTSERERTRANAEPCHSCHGTQTRSWQSASAASSLPRTSVRNGPRSVGMEACRDRGSSSPQHARRNASASGAVRRSVVRSRPRGSRRSPPAWLSCSQEPSASRQSSEMLTPSCIQLTVGPSPARSFPWRSGRNVPADVLDEGPGGPHETALPGLVTDSGAQAATSAGIAVPCLNNRLRRPPGDRPGSYDRGGGGGWYPSRYAKNSTRLSSGS
jgi:hypothetical protein